MREEHLADVLQMVVERGSERAMRPSSTVPRLAFWQYPPVPPAERDRAEGLTPAAARARQAPVAQGTAMIVRDGSASVSSRLGVARFTATVLVANLLRLDKRVVGRWASRGIRGPEGRSRFADVIEGLEKRAEGLRAKFARQRMFN